MKENGVKVLSAMENILDTPEGIILESLLEGMNQYYSAELSQKVLRGLRKSYLKGQYTGGLQVYGYNVVNKKLVINPEEAEIVREILVMLITWSLLEDNNTLETLINAIYKKHITEK